METRSQRSTTIVNLLSLKVSRRMCHSIWLTMLTIWPLSTTTWSSTIRRSTQITHRVTHCWRSKTCQFKMNWVLAQTDLTRCLASTQTIKIRRTNDHQVTAATVWATCHAYGHTSRPPHRSKVPLKLNKYLSRGLSCTRKMCSAKWRWKRWSRCERRRRVVLADSMLILLILIQASSRRLYYSQVQSAEHKILETRLRIRMLSLNLMEALKKRRRLEQSDMDLMKQNYAPGRQFKQGTKSSQSTKQPSPSCTEQINIKY